MKDQTLFWGPLDPMVDRGLTGKKCILVAFIIIHFTSNNANAQLGHDWSSRLSTLFRPKQQQNSDR